MELQSEKLDKITPALIAARKEILGAVNNGRGNWGSYATLEDIIEACNDPLLDHQIFISQASTPIEGHQYIVTQATHVTGQFMRSLTKIENGKPGNPQTALASQTYTRRAGLESLLNIPRIDDDGEQATPEHLKEKPKKKTPKKKPGDDVPYPDEILITKPEQTALINLALDFDVAEQAKNLIKSHGFENSKEITKDKLKQITKEITDLGNILRNEK